MGIGERVRDAHLRHLCPGGVGFPVTSPTMAGPGLLARSAQQQAHVTSGHRASADGETCGQCGQRLTAGQDVRRSASGAWLHENCPGERSRPSPPLTGSRSGPGALDRTRR